MAEQIRGISIVIDGDTTALTKALGNVNKESKSIQTELKSVEKLLQMDPGNAELISQKHKLLADAVNTTKQKLDALKTAQEQVNQQFKAGTISEGQYRAFQREIVATEQQLKKFEQQLESTQKTAGGVGEKLETGVIGKMKGMINPANLAAGAVAGIGAVAVGVAAKGLSMATDWDEASRKMAAATGLPIEAMGEFETQAEKMYAAGRGEADEIYAAMTKVQQVFKGTAEETGTLADKALILQKTFGYDVNESIKAVDSMVKNFGVDGNAAFDIIAQAATLSGDKSQDLLDTLNEYSPQFASMGFGAEEFAGILVKGAELGAFSIDKMGDAVKELNIRAQDGSKTTAEGFAAIGLNADQMGAAIAAGGDKAQMAFEATIAGLAAMEDPLERDKAGVALFGSLWEDLRGNVILAMADGKNALGDFSGATDAAAGKLDGGLGPVLGRIGKQFELIVKEIADNLKPAFEQLATWIENHLPQIQAVISGACDAIAFAFKAITFPIKAAIDLIGASPIEKGNEKNRGLVLKTVAMIKEKRIARGCIA